VQDVEDDVSALNTPRCETKKGKKSKLIGMNRPGRKPLSAEIDQRLRAFVLKQHV
jgi:hypothetical protein